MFFKTRVMPNELRQGGAYFSDFQDSPKNRRRHNCDKDQEFH